MTFNTFHDSAFEGAGVEDNAAEKTGGTEIESFKDVSFYRESVKKHDPTDPDPGAKTIGVGPFAHKGKGV